MKSGYAYDAFGRTTSSGSTALTYYTNDMAASETFRDRADALAGLDAERPNLVATVTVASTTARLLLAVTLTASLTEFLHWHRHFDDAITTVHQPLAAARDLNNRRGEGRALTTSASRYERCAGFTVYDTCGV
ncbi:hypothetical protein [Streptomyces sp. SAS_276]|uniref:hypothetical protein n=1 Tax=Streptomyces sp. SAS_276 TaxID=3412745 RepID=UPI00403CE8E8